MYLFICAFIYFVFFVCFLDCQVVFFSYACSIVYFTFCTVAIPAAFNSIAVGLLCVFSINTLYSIGLQKSLITRADGTKCAENYRV